MKLAAARGIAEVVSDDELAEDYIVPSVFNREVSRGGRQRRRGEGGARRLAPVPRQVSRVTVTGGTGMIGRQVVDALRARGDEVTVLSRSAPEDACTGPIRPPSRRRPRRSPDATPSSTCSARTWRSAGPTRPSSASASRASSARATSSRDSRGWRTVSGRAALVSMSAIGFYGARGDERVDESEPAGDDDFLAEVVRVWEARGARRRRRSACG